MNPEEREKIVSNDFTELIAEAQLTSRILGSFENVSLNVVDEKYVVFYFPRRKMVNYLKGPESYSSIPKLFGLLDTSNLDAMGVNKVRTVPTLSLRGSGVLLGFIDTGIDYTLPIFQYGDKTSRILSLWDQTITNPQATADTFFYGQEYSREQINSALKDPSPLSIVPSTDDEGHGTTLAGLAGGSIIEKDDFSGVAPDSEYVIVKLKPAKPHMKEFWGVPDDILCYSETDLLFGIRYLVDFSKKVQRPLVICIGVGTNQGGHEGLSILDDVISNYAVRSGMAIIIAAGNEGNVPIHYFGEIPKETGFDTVELQVAEKEHNFSMELWGNSPGTYSIDIMSPTGEYISRIPARLDTTQEISFLFEPAVIYIDYLLVEAYNGDQLIHLRFTNPTPGIWRFRVYGSSITSGFHIWLPMSKFITKGTGFIHPNQETTLTNPANNHSAITATAYNHQNQSIYIDSSRGYTRYQFVKPDFAVPGVNIYSPLPGEKYVQSSGTSIAAAQLTGIAALLLEWGVIKGNDPRMSSTQIRKFLIRGVKRSQNITYPNTDWGFGIANIFGIFESLLTESS